MSSSAVFSAIPDILRHRAETTPERLAYRFLRDGETDVLETTYATLDQQARTIAAKLQALNLQGERALLLYPPGPDFIAALFGCFYSSILAVPIHALHAAWLKRKQATLRHILTDATPAITLTTQEMGRTLRPAFRADQEMARTRWLSTDGLSPDLAGTWAPASTSPALTALLQYTSGSTQTPRGVQITHANLMHNSATIKERFGHTPDSRTVLWLPPYHDMGLGGIIQAIYTGFELTLMSPLAFLQRPLRWLQAISRYQATTSGGPNFAYDRCLQTISEEQRDTLDLSHWDLAFIGAEPVRAETLDRFTAFFAPSGFQRTAWYPCYGLAESTLMVSGGTKQYPPLVQPLDAEALRHGHAQAPEVPSPMPLQAVGCGPGADATVLIMHPETRLRCADNEIGEIWVAGASVAAGYWKNPEATTATFEGYRADTNEGPFLRTGDLGFLQNDELFITGRLKEVIVINGRNHYPQDIEATVATCHPAIQAGGCAAFGIDQNHQERLVLALELERRTSRTHNITESRILAGQESAFEKEILSKIRTVVSTLHDLHVHDVLLIPFGHLPKTSSGKTKRFVCKERYLAHQSLS